MNKLDILYNLSTDAYLPFLSFASRVKNISDFMSAKDSKIMIDYEA